MESDIYLNTSINYKKHENHTKISLVQINDIFCEIDKLIGKIMKDENFLNNLYKSIENIKNFLENINNYKSNSEALQIEFKNNLKTNNEEELLSNIFFSSNISSINIQNKEKMNMAIFYKKDFRSLEELMLVGNGIKDIS